MNIKKTKTFLIASFVLASLGLLYFIGITYFELKSAYIESEKSKISIKKLTILQAIHSDIRNLETYQFSFIIDNNKKHILDIEQTEIELKNNVAFLENLIANDVEEKRNFDAFKISINKNLLFIKETILIKERFGNDSADAVISSGRGIELMDDYKNQINSFRVSKINQLEKSNRINYKLLNSRFLFINIGYTIAVLFFGFMFFWIFREIKKLRIRERLLQLNSSILLNIYDPIITTDKSFIITDWNKYAEQLFGFSKAEAVGVRLSILLNTDFGASNLEEVLTKIDLDEKWNGNLTYISKDGIPINVNASTSNFYDEQNKVIGTVTVIRNISNQIDIQKNLEKEVELKISEQKLMNTRFELMMEATDDAIWDMKFGSDKIWGNKKYLSYFNNIVDEHILYEDLQARIHPVDLIPINDHFTEDLLGH
jgi:PAS domain S-box-containing protein